MFEYLAYALLGLVMVGGLLYVTMSAEAEEPARAKRPAPSGHRTIRSHRALPD